MEYASLSELLRHSSATRRYFISLPVDMQMTLHDIDKSIHTAQQLHSYVFVLGKQDEWESRQALAKGHGFHLR